MAIALSASYGQELILPLGENLLLDSNAKKKAKKHVSDVLLELPLTDDFSYDSLFPSSALWADDYAFINNGYAIDPPTVGVATMDALDENGSIYSFATITPATFDADLLTSHPVNLAYPASDSIYLSFYYQPEGRGLQPQERDSLCLDFYDVDSARWINVWRAAGDTSKPFQQVMIPVTEERFLKEGFRFGFRNKASLPKSIEYRDKRGNVDHWHIDYVRLARNRTFSDTVIRDVAFSKAPPSMLKDYESIPWDHFETGYNTLYKPFVTIDYYNNDSATRNITRYMEIEDEVWNETYDPGASTTQDIFPGTSTSYNFTSIYPFQFTRGETGIFNIKAWLRTDEFDNKENDTIVRKQVFRDYFAYDDGSAERAYGLRGDGTKNGLIAVRFESFIADELGGVDIYFTQLKDSLNLDYYYRFMVWDDFEGQPGTLIYDDEIERTVVYTSKLNKFKRFLFQETVPVDGTFYVGLLQYNQYLLNIGLDINKAANGNLFYNLGSEWQVSEAPGTLMIRPFVMRSYSDIKHQEGEAVSLKIWPNPAADYIRLELPEKIRHRDVQMNLYDITGKLVESYPAFQQEIPVSHLQEGLYLLSFPSQGNTHFRTQRIVIQR